MGLIQASLRDARVFRHPVPALKGRPKFMRRSAAETPALRAGLETLRENRVNAAARRRINE